MKFYFFNTFARVCIAALVSLIVGLTALDPLAAGQETKRVFVLNSFNHGYAWTDNMLRGIDDACGSSGFRVETYVTFMDMKRIPPTPQYFSQLKELIREGYSGVRFDAVLACDNDAFEFTKRYRDELFPGVPVVFSSINDFDERMLAGQKDITGTSENTDYTGTIKIALKLRPETRNIVVVVDNTTTGKAHRSAVEKIRPDFPQSLAFIYISLADLTLDELAQQLSKLSSDSIVLLLQHFVDRNQTTHTVQQSTPLLTKSSAVPVFVLADIRMGLGALGGDVVSGYHHGEAAAQMVVKILNGVDVKLIPVLLNSPNRYLFDYSVMQRFNIPESALPQGSIVINKPVSVLDRYRTHLFAILGGFIVLSGILVFQLLEISRRRKIEASLMASENKFRNLVETISDVIFEVTDRGNVTYVSPVGLKIWGGDPSEIIGKNFIELVHPEDRALLIKRFSELRQGVEGPETYRFVNRTGRIIWVRSRTTPIMENGEFKGARGTLSDITAQRQAEEERLKLEKRLQQAQKDESLNRMAGAIAHHFNNQLMVVIGNLELGMEDMPPGGMPLKNLTEAMKAARRAAEVSSLMLTYLGQTTAKQEPVDICEVCSRSLPLLRATLPETVLLETDLPSPGPTIKGNANQMQQLLTNLITNAGESCDGRGAIHLSIKTVSAENIPGSHRYPIDWQPQDTAYACLEVKDPGGGMADNDIEKIFDPFFTSKFTGRGLGLAVVLGVLRAHHGAITVESQPDRGSIFRVFLPVSAEALRNW